VALDIEGVAKQLDDAKAFAARVGLAEQLEERLRFLDQYGGPSKVTRCVLYKDLAPYSFTFVMEIRGAGDRWRAWFEGGLIYHGAHDGHGCGCAPTYAVTMEATNGWSIHT
jgi:hypothetical protein